VGARVGPKLVYVGLENDIGGALVEPTVRWALA
jgi:hypothetical protein